MKIKLINFWMYLKASFWFVPALMILLAILFAFSLVTLDRALSSVSFRYYGFTYSVSPEGARAVLSTIAGSMMTVAGVTFSITIVVLNLASSQFGPRLMRNFIQDRSIQFVLGAFVASFIYCLLVLRSVETLGADMFVPNLSVIFAIVLAIFNVGVLIFFIHNIATSIQADVVVAEISRELRRNIQRIIPDELDYDTLDEKRRKAELLEEKNTDHHYLHKITAPCDGYLQALDHDRLLHLATEYNYIISLQLRQGQYAVAYSTIAIITSQDIFDVSLTDTITNAFIFGSQRTPEQDAEYPIHQLVEVAVRALSPGVNDPFTTLACIEQLTSTINYLSKRSFPSPYYFDDEDQLRLKIKPFTYSGILNASFDQIRQYGSTSVAVTIRLLETLTILAEQTRRPDQRTAIHRQATMILRGSERTLPEENDRKDVWQRYQLLLESLNKFEDKDESYESPDEISFS